MSRVATRIASNGRFTSTVASATLMMCATSFGGCYIVADQSPDSGNVSCAAGDPQCNGPINPGTGGPPSPTAGGGSYSPGTGGTGGPATGTGGPLPHVTKPPATCPTVTVSRFNELMIIDPAVTNDARADNESTYRPWSFRQRIEALVPGAPEAAGPLADAWLAGWSSLTDVPASAAPGASHIPIEPRPAAQQVLRCPWLSLSLENGCDAACVSCRSRQLDLGRAPFRLLAIVNRVDLATSSTAAGGAPADACGVSGGELRFVYGAADPVSLRPLPFTVIFEYTITLLPGETLRDWAAAWHELGALVPGSSAFNARLDAVVAAGIARAALRRVLSNEVAFGASDGLPWEMRQFVPALTDAGTIRLIEVATAATPRLTLAASPELGQWIDANATTILAGDNPLPASLIAASAPIPTADFAWRTSAADAAVGASFNRNTCSGCHGGRSDPADVPFQHIAPPSAPSYGATAGPTSAARLSRFLHDPGHDDELGRRERQMAAALCAACGTSSY